VADNQLLPEDPRYAAGPGNALAQQPTWADAAQWHGQNLADTWAAMQDPSMWVDAARQYGSAIMFGTIGGPMAKTADLAQLEAARALEAKGVGRDDILSQTGWFKGPDGNWRFEINDQGMSVNPRTGYGTTLGQAITHPELFEAYPQLRDIQVETGGRGGAYYPGQNIMRVGAASQNVPATFLHETQHAIQDIEGTEQGGSAAQMGDRDLYRRLYGEAEARAVESRMRLDPQSRLDAGPWWSFDVPENQLIVRRRP